jgi:hypothetical protein
MLLILFLEVIKGVGVKFLKIHLKFLNYATNKVNTNIIKYIHN